MVLSVVMIRSEFLVLSPILTHSPYCGSLNHSDSLCILGPLKELGSFHSFGALGICDSFSLIGSLDTNDSLTILGSLAMLGLLTVQVSQLTVYLEDD